MNNTSTEPVASAIAMSALLLNSLTLVNNTIESPSSSARALDMGLYLESQTISNNLFIGSMAGQAVRC